MSHSEQPANPPNGTHIIVLLDRSGSMASIANDVIGGFNTFLADQQQNGPDARISIVLFDSQDPQETVVWGAPISEATPLDAGSYVPRGGTPLLDATGLTIGRVIVEQASREATGLAKNDIIFVTITDGEENQSTEYSLDRVRQLITERTADGWQFVYLSAGLDAYADAARLGYDQGATQAWRGDGVNANLMFSSMSKGTINRREKRRRGETAAPAEFFETGKDAEEGL